MKGTHGYENVSLDSLPRMSNTTKEEKTGSLLKAVTAGVITQEEKDKYDDCVDDDWNPIYGEKWNKCQGLYDKFHKHNEVNTFSLNSRDGIIEPITKNTLLMSLGINTTHCSEWFPNAYASKYHQFKYIYGAL